MNKDIDAIIEYSEGRDKAIIDCIKTDSVEPFKAFIDSWKDKGVFPECFALPSDEVLAISIRKMCLHCTNIAPEIKGQAVNWLLDRNYDLEM